MLTRLVPPAGLDVVDVGCGGGAAVRELNRLGARAAGIDVSEGQLASARAADPGGRYLVGSAQALPLDDASVDVVVFMRSLHHVAPGEMMPALAEARRVLRPEGAVYVAEPLAEGDYFALGSIVEDEREVRRAAQRALADARAARLRRAVTVEYEVEVRLASLEELRRRIVSAEPRRAEVFEAHADRLAQQFERLGSPAAEGRGRQFVQPMRADLLRAG